MIKFGKGGHASFDGADVGDTFTKIEYHLYGAGVMSVIDYVITKVGKRDIKYESKSNRHITIYRNVVESSCYPVGHAYSMAERKEIKLSNRRYKCAKILASMPRIKDYFDEQFMTAIEEFGARLEARR